MRVRNCLEAVKSADRLVDVLPLADELAVEVGRDTGPRNIRILLSAIESDDQVTAIAAIHALAHISDESVDVILSSFLSHDHGFVREHAAWSLRGRVPRATAIGRLVGLVVSGEFAAMLAQHTLEAWAATAPELVIVALESALIGVTEPDARYRLVETLGLILHSTATSLLMRVIDTAEEDLSVRAAAVAALGDHPETDETTAMLTRVARSGGYLGEVAQLSLSDCSSGIAQSDETAWTPRGDGLTVAQLFLHADIDAELRHAGSGDNGGIATLLVRLGDALVRLSQKDETVTDAHSDRRLPVNRVLTLSRGSVGEALLSTTTLPTTASGHLYGSIPLMQEPTSSANAWPLRVAARRGIARQLKTAGNVAVIHLRMGDVGTLAAFDVARTFDIPVVFTAAPDPHALINSLDLSGTLTRQNFGTIDEKEHFWFRARLVQRLAAHSSHVVFFPRPHLREDMKKLVGIDIADAPERHTVVPEGIDLTVTDQAVAEAKMSAGGAPLSAPLAEFRALLERLPAERRGLPLLISVGRLHRVKGMATVVEAWAGSELRHLANLVLVGGNLQTPSTDEREQLDCIDRIIDPRHRYEEGLVLAGHRPNNTVSQWIAAAYTGMPGLIAPNGVYVCGSLKEEFGLAILEAMASGLLVVVPNGGGPATYVEHGKTGFLTTTWDIEMLTQSIHDALLLAAAETTSARAVYSRGVVQDRFTVESMAEALTTVYSNVHHDDVQLRKELVVPA